MHFACLHADNSNISCDSLLENRQRSRERRVPWTAKKKKKIVCMPTELYSCSHMFVIGTLKKYFVMLVVMGSHTACFLVEPIPVLSSCFKSLHSNEHI